MKIASYLVTLSSLSALVICAIVPQNNIALQRRQDTLICSPWTLYGNMTSTPDTLIESVGVSEWRHLPFKQWRGFFTQIESASSIKAVELVARVTGDAFLTLETKAKNNVGLEEHSLLLAEVILIGDPKFQYAGRHIWRISGDANHHCYVKTGYTDKDVQDIRVWQPKAGLNSTILHP